MAEAMRESTHPGTADPTDAIAELLVAEDESEAKEEEQSDKVEEKAETGESSEDVTAEVDDQLEEFEPEEVPESDESEDDPDVTWGGVLGLDDSQVVLDGDDFVGVQAKVDDSVEVVKLPDLLAGYQSNRANTRKSQALSAERKEFEAYKEQSVADYKKRLDDLENLTLYLNKKLADENDPAALQQLRSENPAEWAARMQERELRAQEYQQFLAAIENERAEQKQTSDQKMEADRRQYLAEQARLIAMNNPDWVNPEVAKKAFSDLGNFANEQYGVTPEEFSNTVDARIIEVLKDARKYREGQKIASQKPARNIPKFQKSSGKAPKKKPSKLNQLVKQAKAAKGANKRDLQSEAIAELLIGGN